MGSIAGSTASSAASANFRLEMRELRADVNTLRGELYATKRWMMGLWLSGALGFAALFVQIALQS